MERLVLVCLGSALGGGARYLASLAVARWIPLDFPLATLGVNALGSFLLGLLMPVALHSAAISAEARLFLATGLLGGFTTYSTFNYETLELAHRGDLAAAALNLAATVAGCLAAGAAGLAAGRALAA